jgi:hypothetical protein
MARRILLSYYIKESGMLGVSGEVGGRVILWLRERAYIITSGDSVSLSLSISLIL